MSSQEPAKQEQPPKEEQKPAAEKPAEAKAAAAAAAQEPAAASEQAGRQEKPKAEKQTNCPICNKPIKRLTRHYRDGKFYCGKKCWRAFREKSKQEKNPPKE